MHSRQLDAALTALIGTVAAHLRADLARGAEVPFELDSHGARSAGTPLYCYRALTREFIAERDAEIRRLPGYTEAAKLLEGFDGLDRYLGSAGVDVVRVKGRGRARAAISALIEDVFEEQTDFKVRRERLAEALRRVHEASSARVGETVLVATLHGMAIASAELPLAKGLTIAKREAIAGMPDTTSASATQRTSSEHLLVVHRVQDEDPRAAIRRGSAVLRDLLTALRLFGDARIALGGVGWAQVGGGPWSPLALGVCGRAHGALVLASEQEDELRAFCNLVSRRAPHGNELAWALERFEMGCERARPLQALSDHLLALRALLEPEGYWSGMLPARLAALCATPSERTALAERASAAVERERAAIEGKAALDAEGKALAEEIAAHLKALLRDVICGHLSPDLAGFADELLAREEDVASDVEGTAHGDRWDPDSDEHDERAGGEAEEAPDPDEARDAEEPQVAPLPTR